MFQILNLWETEAGWDFVKNTMLQVDEWWKKAKNVCSLNGVSHIIMHQYHFITNNVFPLLYYRT